ncbi:heat shock protein 70 family [Artemisia annua]|uniref:Heat shock protein 70 family n=1 Tax=Artemisia annua TaxID=35608 RepID=A0A2U1QDV6_ARTAN|nr:heat shock protein 70 family [Artemisia annua]
MSTKAVALLMIFEIKPVEVFVSNFVLAENNLLAHGKCLVTGSDLICCYKLWSQIYKTQAMLMRPSPFNKKSGKAFTTGVSFYGRNGEKNKEAKAMAVSRPVTWNQSVQMRGEFLDTALHHGGKKGKSTSFDLKLVALLMIFEIKPVEVFVSNFVLAENNLLAHGKCLVTGSDLICCYKLWSQIYKTQAMLMRPSPFNKKSGKAFTTGVSFYGRNGEKNKEAKAMAVSRPVTWNQSVQMRGEFLDTALHHGGKKGKSTSFDLKLGCAENVRMRLWGSCAAYGRNCSKENQIPGVKALTGAFSLDFQYAEVKVKTRLNFHGIFFVDSAQLIEEEEVQVPVTKEPSKEATKMDTDDASANVPWANDTTVNMEITDCPVTENGVNMETDTKYGGHIAPIVHELVADARMWRLMVHMVMVEMVVTGTRNGTLRNAKGHNPCPTIMTACSNEI